MGKQMIEEMARIIAFDLCPNRSVHARWGEEAQCYSDNNFAECKEIKNVVDKLYNAGYRKIPKNAVVLTREKYEELKQAKTLLEFREETIKLLEDANIRYAEALEHKVNVKERKETAEKFVSLLEERCKEKVGFEYSFGNIRNIIDEICKEITEGKV